MALPRRGGGSRVTLALLVLVSLTLITLDYQGFGPLERVRDGVNDLVSPIRGGLEDVTSPITDAWHGITDYGNVAAENDALREQVAELEGRLAQVEADAAAYAALLEEVGLVESDYPTVIARVVGGPTGNFADHTVEIDKGTDAGLQPGMAVATSAGLVGRILRVSAGRSIVQLVSDPDVRWGVRLVDSQDVGIAHGIGDAATVAVSEGIDEDTEVSVGELVVTSGGRSSFFPEDIPVGRVASIEEREGGAGRELRVELLADLDDLAFVTVVLYEVADEPPGSDPGTEGP
ncbi:MAG: rod shape-determining protein MreC [Acidimicrobiales bacterium]|nr:rod shape-determining protein MreC [Acidimicrobiales bacterium]